MDAWSVETQNLVKDLLSKDGKQRSPSPSPKFFDDIVEAYKREWYENYQPSKPSLKPCRNLAWISRQNVMDYHNRANLKAKHSLVCLSNRMSRKRAAVHETVCRFTSRKRNGSFK